MKKGFTLVEILSVIVILAVIATLFVPNTIKLLKENNIKIYKVKEKELLRAAEDYANFDENFSFPQNTGDYRYITISQLTNGNYLNKILDSKSANECAAFVRVSKDAEINGYKYEPCIICDEYKTDKDYCELSTYQGLA